MSHLRVLAMSRQAHLLGEIPLCLLLAVWLGLRLRIRLLGG